MNMFSSDSTCHIQGAITGFAGDVLYGWALDVNAPDLRLAVEIYVNSAFVALVRADLDQGIDTTLCTNTAHALSDGFHGFVLQLRKSWLRDGAIISARIANQGPWLGTPLRLPIPKDVATAMQAHSGLATSQVWYTGGLVIRGWVWDATEPARHVKVRVLEEITGSNSQLVKEVLADQPHPALVYQTSANHGFVVELPWSLADGKIHHLSIETDNGTPLAGSPVTVCLHPEGARALLPLTVSQTSGASPALKLLDTLLERQDILAPRSTGFDAYPQWFDTFQQPQTLQPDFATPAYAGVVLVLLIHSDSEQDAAISLHSIRQQRLPAAQIRVLSVHASDSSAKLAGQLATQLADAEVKCLVPLQRGDHLPAHALDTLLHSLTESGADWCYADCDQDDSNGQRHNPWLKPAWDETLFYGADLITPGCALSANAVRRALQNLAERAPDLSINLHSLLASAIATRSSHIGKAGNVAGAPGPIVHIPQVLYHRSHHAPAAPHVAPIETTRYAALQWLAQQRMPGATVHAVDNFPGLTRVQWPLPPELPRVSLIIPTRDHLALIRTCVEGLLTQTDYPDLEIIVVDNDSQDPDTLAWLQDIPKHGVHVLRYPHPFNYAAINNWAVKQAQGQIIGLINNDIAIRHPGWLREMVSHLLRPDIGAVGARLLWPNGMVQHGGVVVGINGLAAHTGNYDDQHDAGYLGFNQVAREQSAVTAACLLVRKQDYEQVGGLDAKHFPVAFNDVDFCLRLRQTGLALVWTPFATLTHAESASRGKEDSAAKVARAEREQRYFLKRWTQKYRGSDPYYHPSLSTDYSTGPYGGLALPPHPLNSRLYY